nr:zwei Ig domain protein zig-8-like [Procambarus clarkii]
MPWEPNSPGPMFDPSPPQNVTALKDDIAYLHCIVHNRGNKTVSWIRVSDLHILTVAQYTYTADDRFEVIHSPDSNSQSWILKINSVQPRDSGRYECQVNTHQTDPITFPVYLSVFVPTARIMGLAERYVDQGSTINLTCIINFNPESPTEIFWYHNNKVINYDNRDSRVSVITDRGSITKTILLIHDAHDAATGTYSCVPSHSATASVRIHILNGEMPAAMQTNGAITTVGWCRWRQFVKQPTALLPPVAAAISFTLIHLYTRIPI